MFQRLSQGIDLPGKFYTSRYSAIDSHICSSNPIDSTGIVPKPLNLEFRRPLLQDNFVVLFAVAAHRLSGRLDPTVYSAIALIVDHRHGRAVQVRHSSFAQPPADLCNLTQEVGCDVAVSRIERRGYHIIPADSICRARIQQGV